jgi:hypothetical protein
MEGCEGQSFEQTQAGSGHDGQPANLLWHSTHTSWFEYNAGLRCVHFRFPERYCKEAQDGVRPFFEKPGPITRQAQPTIGEPGIHAKVMEKINKVIRRRYLLTFGITIKLYIKCVC